MFSSHFFRRIFLPYLLLICVATAAVGIFAALRLRDSYLAGTRAKLHNEAVLVSDLLAPDLAAVGEWPPEHTRSPRDQAVAGSSGSDHEANG